MEAERLRQEEEAKLRKKMNNKKAKEEAERHHQVNWIFVCFWVMYYYFWGMLPLN